ncbi:MAG TPA: hypothetical protein VJX70_12915 [Candidatus Acidoferrum sp.]|nr:hypothetical protein [Candidatus Acidoferrum sp.]
MKSRAVIALALSISFAAGLIVGESKQKSSTATVEPAYATNAAFRDGLYQAKLDTEEGRKPHLAFGRWNTTEARASFFAGYRRGYHPTSEAAWGGMGGPSVAELAAAGYRDGMLDGSWHRIASQPFQAEATTNYRAAGAVYLGTAVATEGYKHFYREGYMNGYQHAYFTRLELPGEKGTQ